MLRQKDPVAVTRRRICSQDSLIGVFFGQYCTQHCCAGDKIEKNVMGAAYIACGGEKWRIQSFGGET